MQRWERYLPPHEWIRHESYGHSTGEFLIIHKTIGDLEREPNGDGEDAARYGAMPGAPSWHVTIGGAGSCYRNLDFNQMGAHDLGANSITVGIEHDTPGPVTPEMYDTSAQVAAAWCHWRGRRPSRDIIIGHDEDAEIGGDSSHTDPTHPAPWDWAHYMRLVETYYNGGVADMGMTDAEKEAFDQLRNRVQNQAEKISNLEAFQRGIDAFYTAVRDGKGKPADFDTRPVAFRQGWRHAERGFKNPKEEVTA